MDIDVFVSKQLKLQELERDAEISERSEYLQDLPLKALQQRGVLVQCLNIGAHCTSLFGRCICTFQSQRLGKILPAHRITPGDIVGVCEGDGHQRKVLCSGVADQVNTVRLKVAFDSNWESLNLLENQHYSLLKLTNDVTYKRTKRALLDLQKPEYKNSPLVQVLFGHAEPGTNSLETDVSQEQFLNKNLNDEQRTAVNFALKQKQVALIHGPPGTGKTTTLVEIIRQTLKRKTKVLVCAPSNVAVDNVVEQLTRIKPIPHMVRLGHPSRLLPQIQEYSLDALLDKSHHATVLDDIRKELDKLNKQGGQFQRQQYSLKKELQERERLAEKDVLRSADVVLSTLTAASQKGPLRHLQQNHFGLIIIDECSQATEAVCWIVLPMAVKCVIAGDHLQLPPTIISNQAAAEGLSVSLMERLSKLLGEECTHMLCTQYRMHQQIMDWASKQLYSGMLKADILVAEHKLCELPGVEENETTECVLLLVDTAGCDLSETEIEGEESKANPGEAAIVCIHVSSLISSGVSPSEIAVITPYNLQVEYLHQRLGERYPTLEIQSVDGFQGREKEAVILSLVRSNERREVGFLSESRRINVAVTRARRHLAVVCDTETVNTNSFLQSLTEHISTCGEVHTAHQYTQALADLEPCGLLHKGYAHKDGTRKNFGTKLEHQKGLKTTNQKTQKKKPASQSEARTPARPRSSEEELIARFQNELQEFLNNDNAECCSFSPELSSFERRIVHLVSERLGLVHISKDEGEKRLIQVFKKCPEERTPEKQNGVPKTVAKPKESRPPEATSSHMIGSEEIETHKGTFTEDCMENNTSIKNDKKVKKKKKKTGGPVPPKNKDDDDDDYLDALLTSTLQLDNTCSQPGCTTSIALISQTCRHCRSRWCLKHSLPEAHGCGQAAKLYARREMLNPSEPPKVDPVRRVHLKRSLEKTLSKMGQQRKPKQEQSKK